MDKETRPIPECSFAMPRKLDVDGWFALGKPWFQISVDGKPVEKVRAYDMDAGWVLVLAMDEKGDPILSADKTKVLEKRIRGRITIDSRFR